MEVLQSNESVWKYTAVVHFTNIVVMYTISGSQVQQTVQFRWKQSTLCLYIVLCGFHDNLYMYNYKLYVLTS